MIRRNTIAFALAGALALGGAGVAYAQSQEQHQEQHMGMMAGCPMMQGATDGAAVILEHQERLNLNENQVARLEALQSMDGMEGMEEMMRMMEMMRRCPVMGDDMGDEPEGRARAGGGPAASVDAHWAPAETRGV